MVREGAISLADIQRIVPSALGADMEPEMWSPPSLAKAEPALDLVKEEPAAEEPAGAETAVDLVKHDATE